MICCTINLRLLHVTIYFSILQHILTHLPFLTLLTISNVVLALSEAALHVLAHPLVLDALIHPLSWCHQPRVTHYCLYREDPLVPHCVSVQGLSIYRRTLISSAHASAQDLLGQSRGNKPTYTVPSLFLYYHFLALKSSHPCLYSVPPHGFRNPDYCFRNLVGISPVSVQYQSV